MARIIYGINPVLEALKSHPELIEEIWLDKKTLLGKKYQILEKAKKLGISVKIISKSEFRPPKLGPHINTQGVVAYLTHFKYVDLEDIVRNWEKKKEIPLILILDEIEDPQNVGSIIRSADAGGVHGIVIPKIRSCEINETVIKVSSGSAFNIPIAKVTNLKHAISFFKEKNLWILGLTHKTDQVLYQLDLKIPLALIVGNENRGIRKTILESCDFLAKIPMKGKIESLNVSIATAVAIFEVIRQREFF
ncbi:23S rRNA (guanosine(2251)-2'-O)-methyltransferase RlmB [Thermodesulfobacterium hydrogeniphilum]|uniref:23S rRNA (guanosine(2251)-2'-O)-methyltransferase RlmB n=1 Tax=Thermodesulfobacterium hydrogeniphilum TaxID=161156 RepID=UPI000570B955|nr:23S rRNA (guanosine(2251)-2'-O)-methyltransferase RlmB [Thermodesulfobacterium hydrogeniphilum]